MFFDPIIDLLGRRDHNIDIFAKGEAEIFSRARVERIGESNAQSVSAQTNRKCAVQAR